MTAGRGKTVLVLVVAILFAATQISGCASQFPRPGQSSVSGDELFAQTLATHGGNNISLLNDVNVAIDGKWPFLITRIQPLLTDHHFRQQSEERILVGQMIYGAAYSGGKGSKRVYRDRSAIRVVYDGVETTESQKLSATALTADSFILFTLGPLALARHITGWQRLPDQQIKGKRHHVLYRSVEPGFGLSERDEIVLYVDADTNLTRRIQITLEGFAATRGASVDVTYEDYIVVEGFTFPKELIERVRQPLALDVHHWWHTGIDINRELEPDDILITGWSKSALRPATPINQGSGN